MPWFQKETQRRREKSKENDLLSRVYRLKNEKDFARLSRSRKIGYAKLVGVKVRENQLPHSRFGVVVGLRVSKKAVDRNRLKRRLKDIIRRYLHNVKNGYDVMVLVQKSALNSGFNALERDYIKAITKAGIFIETL